MEGDAPDISGALMRGVKDAVEVGYRQGKQTVREIQKKISLADDWHDVLPAEALSWIQGYVPELARVYEADVLEQVRDKIAASLRAGKTEKHVARELRQIQGQVEKFSRHRLEAIARTESMRGYNMGHLRGIIDSQGVAGVEFSAVLDSRTSEACEAREGLRFPLGSPELAYNSPPLHPNCRSILIPVMDVEVPEGWMGDEDRAWQIRERYPTIQRECDIDVARKVLQEKDGRTSSASHQAMPQQGAQQPQNTVLGNIDSNDLRTWAKEVLDDAPEDVRLFLENIQPPPGFFNPQDPHSSFAVVDVTSPRYGIHIGSVSRSCKEDFKAAFCHEMGHMLDGSWKLQDSFNGGYTSSFYSSSLTSDFRKAVEKYTQELLNPNSTITREITDAMSEPNILERVLGINKPWREHEAISDVVCSISHARISGGYGHDAAYYQQGPSFAPAEVFANLLQIRAQNDVGGLAYLKGIFPDLVNAFDAECTRRRGMLP